MWPQVLGGKVQLPHTALYSQSKGRKREALPLYLMVPVWLFPVEVTLGGTVVPLENPQKKCCQRRRKSVRWLCSIRAQRLLHTRCCSEINGIAYLMNKMWFCAKINIQISQIQYQRQYQLILEVNRWSVNNMSIYWAKNSSYWFGWCDWNLVEYRQKEVESLGGERHPTMKW